MPKTHKTINAQIARFRAQIKRAAAKTAKWEKAITKLEAKKL